MLDDYRGIAENVNIAFIKTIFKCQFNTFIDLIQYNTDNKVVSSQILMLSH